MPDEVQDPTDTIHNWAALIKDKIDENLAVEFLQWARNMILYVEGDARKRAMSAKRASDRAIVANLVGSWVRAIHLEKGVENCDIIVKHAIAALDEIDKQLEERCPSSAKSSS